MNYTSENTLTEILQKNLNAAIVFRNYNLNYSVEGRKTIKDVCRFAGIKPEKVLTDLKSLSDKNTEYNKVYDWSTDFLCEYIESNHHKYVRKILPKIINKAKFLVKYDLFEKDVLNRIQHIRNDFEIHMQKEERLLFPYIKKMNIILKEKSEYEIPPFGSIVNLIKVIDKEHSIAGNALDKIKFLCNGYKSNNSDNLKKKILYEYLNEFDLDFHMHIHLENNILYPKSILLEKKLNKLFFKKANKLK
jgi:regulator of cell morphogenesis and NO signaling